MQWDQTRSCISPHSLRIWAYHQPSDIHTLNWIRAKVRERGLIFHIPRKRDTLVQRGLSIVYSLFLNLTIPPFSFFCPKAGGLWYYWRDPLPSPFPNLTYDHHPLEFASTPFLSLQSLEDYQWYILLCSSEALQQRDFQRWRRRKPEALPPSKCCQKFTMISAPYFDVWFVRAKDSTHSSKNDRSWPKILVTPFADLLLASGTNQDQKGLVK